MRPIDESQIRQAVTLLQQAAPGSTVIVFGSTAKGVDSPHDLDLLVVEPSLESKWEQSVRLRDVLRPLRIPVDILVTSRQSFEEWVDTPGTIFHEAISQGRVFHAVS